MDKLKTISESLRINEAAGADVFLIDHKNKGYINLTKSWTKELAEHVMGLGGALEGTGSKDIEVTQTESIDELRYKEYKNMTLTPKLV